MIVQLNAEQARRLTRLHHDYDRPLNHVYESIRTRAVQGYHSFSYIASALPKTEINVILQSLTKNGYNWEYDPGWKIIKISWRE